MKKYWFIGDVHGELQLLRNLIEAIRHYDPDHLVFLGDLVDRGPDPRGVLDLIMELDIPCTCLMGNHELLMLNALGDAIYGNNPMELWYRNGGESTLQSFGIPGFFGYPAEIDQRYLDFLRRLPLNLELELVPGRPVLATHAGLDPGIPIREQLALRGWSELHRELLKNPGSRADAFLWAREDFFRMDPQSWEPFLVIHGHTPVAKLRFISQGLPDLDEFQFVENDICLRRSKAKAGQGQGDIMSICLDSGSVLSGRLSALGILPPAQLISLTATREDIIPRKLGSL